MVSLEYSPLAGLSGTVFVCDADDKLAGVVCTGCGDTTLRAGVATTACTTGNGSDVLSAASASSTPITSATGCFCGTGAAVACVSGVELSLVCVAPNSVV